MKIIWVECGYAVLTSGNVRYVVHKRDYDAVFGSVLGQSGAGSVARRLLRSARRRSSPEQSAPKRS